MNILRSSDARHVTLTSLLLAIGALALGLVAQGYFARPLQMPALKPTDGLLVYAVVVAILGFAVARSPLRPKLDLGRGAPFQIGVRRLVWFLALLCVCGVLSMTALLLFREDAAGSFKWTLYLVSIPLFVFAVYVLSPRAGQRSRISASELSLLLLILVVAAFFRLYRFHDVPYGLWYDEADNGLWARRLLEYPALRPVYASTTNLPAHFLYLVMLAFRLFGDSMWSIRAVAVAFGLLTVVAAYFCGRELFGWSGAGRYLGLFLAFLIAVSMWDVNWSRIGMHGVTVPFFELWTMAALLRGLRSGRLSAFAWSGVALGLGLCFYSPMRVFPAVVGGFLLVWLARWLRHLPRGEGQGSTRRRIKHTVAVWGIPALLWFIGVLIAVAPVAQFALNHPDLFWDRAKKISLFREPQAQAHPVRAVLQATAKHLLMFNHRGDPNGRHNLPGKPMLDQLDAVLFVFGVTLCLLRWRDPRSALLLLWVSLPLSGGILSVSFEAPQSLRSIGALPAAYLLVCLAIEWFVAEWRRVFGAASGPHLRPVLLWLALAIGLSEGVTYFHIWANDFSSWAAFNPAETHIAQDINDYRADYDLCFDPLLTAHLATRYLAPDYQVYHHFDPAMVFPVQGAGDKGALLFVSPNTQIVNKAVQRLYPGVKVEPFAHAGSGRAVLYKYFLDRWTIASVQGLDASYTPLHGGGEGALYQVDRVVDFDWRDDPPAAYPLQVIWSGGLLAPQYGKYTLHVDAPGEVLLALDGRAVFSGRGPTSAQVMMAQGVHALNLDCRLSAPGRVRLMWTVPWDQAETPALNPVPADSLYRASWPINGLVGRFYAGGDGKPKIVRIDRQLAHYFHFLPLPRPYRVEWTGRLLAPVDGVYQLGIKAVSWASLTVDGRTVVETTAPGQYASQNLTLPAGMHDIEVQFFDHQDRSQIYLYWIVPGDERPQLIPPEALFLPQEGTWW